MANAKTFNFEKLNNANYSAWAFKMQMYLMKEGCWDTIEQEGNVTAEQMPNDKKAWNYIVLGVDDSQHVHVKATKGGREAWKVLKEFHVQTSLSARIRIMKTLFRIRLDEGTSMESHLQMIFEKFSELDEIGYGLANEMAVSILLASLNSEYEPLITALEAWDETRLTIQAVRAKLLEEYRRKDNAYQEESHETALKVGRKDDRGYRCNKIGHIGRYCKNVPQYSNNGRYQHKSQYQSDSTRYRNDAKEKANVARVAFIAKIEKKIRLRRLSARRGHRVCYHCQERGHEIDSCPTKPKVKSEIVNYNDELNKEPHSAKMARFSQM